MAKKKKRNGTLIRKRLRKDECPSIFKDLPSYYTQNNHLVRSGLSISSSRFKNEAAQLEEQNKVFLNADKVESFKDLIENCQKSFIVKDILVYSIAQKTEPI